ncbi:MAG TPA: plastocyanin/azurin family copper-binding protein [Gemmatimonadales bacterium]|nr:plastocyanin/azurin family copper-binding protein [Gemmatimonadales bacterium]
MLRLPRGGLGFVATMVGAAPLAGQTVHEIRLRGDAKTGRYAFVPATIRAKPGDVLRFVVESGAPHAVVFEGGALPPAAKAALNEAMPRRFSDLSGPLLTVAGAEYRMTVPRLPVGRYRFFCQPQQAYEMRGELVVER